MIQEKQWLHKLPFWPHLTEKQQQTLKQRVYHVHYPKEHAVRRADSDCLGILLIQSGVLRVYLLSEDGKEATIARLRGGDTCVFSAACAFSAISFDVQIDSETECDAYVIPSDVFSALMKETPYIENYFYRLTVERFSDVISAVERMLFMSLEQRLCTLLLDEASYRHSNDIMLTKEQIARAIGSAREAVSRALKQLVEERCVALFRGGVRILDKNALYHKIDS